MAQQEAVAPTAATAPAAARRARAGALRRLWRGQALLYLTIGVFLVLTFAPVAVMALLSFRDNAQIFTNFWGLPDPWLFSNYADAIGATIHYLVNSVGDTLAAVAITVVFSSLGGYVFARHRFPGKEALYVLILGLLMVPYVIQLVPAFVLTHQLGIWNTPLALILPWAAGGQVLGIFLCRTFIASLPEELFEAARIDGAGDLQLWFRVAIPLSWPILTTVAILSMVADYNDFIWPLLVINDDNLQVVTVGLTQLDNATGSRMVNYGPDMAAYVVASVPLLIAFLFGMRHFVQGITSGAIKA